MADVDGDGDQDLYAGGTSSPHGLWSNGGSGGLSPRAGAVPTLFLSFDSDFFDADGDGDLDLATTDINHVLLVNDGNGNYSEHPSFPFGGTAICAAAGDFDADGDIDLAASNSGSSGALYRNDPGEVWTLSGGITAITNASDLDAGDIDGDGWLDLLVAGDDLVALGDSAGGFQASAYLPLTDVASLRGALADLDADGDLDVVLRQLWENTGSSLVRAMPSSLAAFEDDDPAGGFIAPSATAIGDLDADGDLDVLYDRLLQLENLTRATGWRSLAGLGRPLVLGVHGEPATTWVLAWSLASTQIALPPFGQLQLDPASLHVQAVGVIPASGTATPTIAVPANASLLGIELHWQSLVGSPLRLTDRTTTRLLAL